MILTGRTIPIHKRKWEEKIYMQYYNLFGISKCYTKRYDINISNGQIGMSPAYSFNCYDIKSIFNLIHHSKANIYVTKSFLLFNNWTINRFCKEYNISMEMVQLINDGN